MRQSLLNVLLALWVTPVFGQESDIPASIGRLGDDDPAVRERATTALIEMGKAARAAVQTATTSEDPEVATRANFILQVMTLKENISFSEKLLKVYPKIYADLASDQSVRGKYNIFARLTEFDWEKKERVMPVANGDIGEIVKLIAEGNYDGLTEKEKMRIADICGGTYNDSTRDEFVEHSSSNLIIPGSAGVIAPLLNDGDQGVRAATVIALGNMKAKEYAKNIIPLLKEKGEVRMCAVYALGIFGNAEEIIPLLKDGDAIIRGMVAIALTELGMKNRVPQESFEDIKNFLRWGWKPFEHRAEAALRALGVDDEEIKKAKAP